MSQAVSSVLKQITSAPLPMMLEKMGMSIANAQSALDANSIRLAKELATIEVAIGNESYSLLTLGFTPTFYAFTEASFEMKMEFSVAESEEYGGSLSFEYNPLDNILGSGKSKKDSGDNAANTNTPNAPDQNTPSNTDKPNKKKKTGLQMISASVTAHYSRKFSMSVEASSSIAAKIVSLPAPDAFYEILKSNTKPN